MDITFVIDISHHQDKSLDLAWTRRDGCELCLMKAGEGSSFVDPDFASNLVEARAAGQLVGAYWYQRANVSAAAHVEKIKQVVPRAVPVILDVEHGSGGVALTREIIRLLNADGYRTPLLYLPRWYWQQLGSPSLAGLPPLWSSRYPNNRVGTLAGEWAEVPAHYWNGYGGLDVVLLQFTSSARIAGYEPLDASAFRGTRAQLAARMGGQTQENDMWTEADFNVPLFTDNFNTPQQKTVRFRDFAGELRENVKALVKSQASLVQLLTQQGEATAEEIAEALVPHLTAVVREELSDVDTVDEDAIAKALTDRMGVLLKPTAV